MEKTKKKPSFLARFIPQKGDSRGETLRKIIFLASTSVVIVCVILLVINFTRRAGDEAMNGELQDIKDMNADGQFSIDEQQVEEIKDEVPEILDKYVELYAQNKDIVGWIKIDDTPINYPVLQTTDNDFYLNHNFNKEESFSGSIFADYHEKITYDNTPDNIVLYGHNLMSGEYFSKLTYYYPARYGSLDFYTAHPTIEFDTLYEEGTYKVFAGIFTNTSESDGYVYPYHQKRDFSNKAEFMDFIGNVMDRSAFYTDVDLEYGDQIITLSTCYYYPLGQSHSTRFVLFARKLREGESAEVDVSKAYVNNDPLLFDSYYQILGIQRWQGRTWNTALVKDFDSYTVVSLPETTTAAE